MKYTVVIQGKNERGMIETHSYNIDAETSSEAARVAELHVALDKQHEPGRVTKIIDEKGNNLVG